jgi:phospholipid transport system substrate-binding protein
MMNINRVLRYSYQRLMAMPVLILAMAAFSAQAADNTTDTGDAASAAVELLETTTDNVLKILRDQREQLENEPDRIYKIVDDHILPHLDDITMAKLALGKSWNMASREQKIDFVNEFRDLLVRTYSKSLLEFKDQTIKYFPAVMEGDASRTSVNAEVLQPGAPSIPLAYRMRIKDNAWKVYDIQVDGVSLVTSYRGTFTQEIRKSGIEGLLQYLRDKNEKLSQKEPVKPDNVI